MEILVMRENNGKKELPPTYATWKEVPNSLKKAIIDARTRKDLKEYDSVEEMFDDILNKDED